MSAGGVFKLIANDGKADRMIMATKLLNQRINDVMCARRRAGQADPTPTLVDLERTHILFVNAHFKPFAAIGYEYNKVRPQSGNPALGNTVTFSIPQFGDFFHDMVGHVVLSGVQSSAQTFPVQGTDPQFPANGKNWDGTDNQNVSYSLIDVFARPVNTGIDTQFRNLVFYCQYPGERLFQNVSFDVNGNPLDQYDSTTVVMLRKFTIGADKIEGYKQLVGEEVVRDGFNGVRLGVVSSKTHFETTDTGAQHTDDPTTFSEGVFPSSSASVYANGYTPEYGSSGPILYDVFRDKTPKVNGPQTPKYYQPALEIWNKLRFWFNDDPRLSIASVSIPYGQRFITIDLAAQNLLVFEAPGLYIKQTGGITIDIRAYVSPGTVSEVALSEVELYVNNIFVNPEVHDIYIKRIGFSLIRVYRRQRSATNTEIGGEQQLTQLKWPIEYMFAGLQPAWNVSSANEYQWYDWHYMSRVFHVIPLATEDFHTIFGETIKVNYTVPTPVVDNLSVTAHGISIHDNFPQKFFSAYVPFHYGGSAIVTPSDEGALMINFAIHPRSMYQPSGHINLSRAREFFLRWTTSYVGPTTPATLQVVAIAINFLLITDGSAVLRYST